MIRYAKTGKASTPTSTPTVRSVGGGDPKLKVALPAWSIDPLLSELKGNRERAAAAMASVTERDSVTPQRDKRDMARDRQRRRRAKLKA